MYKTQTALIEHIKQSGIFETVSAYAGEVGKDAVKTNVKLPAALVKCIEGSAEHNPAGNKFDVLVITESKTFDKTSGTNQNLQAASALLEYLDDNADLSFGENSYLLNRDELKAKYVLQTERFTVYGVGVRINKLN